MLPIADILLPTPHNTDRRNDTEKNLSYLSKLPLPFGVNSENTYDSKLAEDNIPYWIRLKHIDNPCADNSSKQIILK